MNVPKIFKKNFQIFEKVTYYIQYRGDRGTYKHFFFFYFVDKETNDNNQKKSVNTAG